MPRGAGEIVMWLNNNKQSRKSTYGINESRIQYGILFADLNTIYFYFNIHKKMICTLLGFTPKSFGFRWRVEPEGKYGLLGK